MTELPATIVDWAALGETVIAALAAGVGVAFTFSLAIYGAARLAEASRHGHRGELALYGVVAVLGLATSLAAIAFGIVVMTSG